MKQQAMRKGELVEVRSAQEILDTLDEKGTLGALPFMAEMLQYCGRRFVVEKRVEKFCDTIKRYDSRIIPDTVILEDLRCEGTAHDNCQADCRFFWKESWLRKVQPDDRPKPSLSGSAGSDRLIELIYRNAKQTQELDGRSVEVYQCQATELYKASEHISVWDPRPYLREFTSGNISIGKLLHISIRAYIEQLKRHIGLYPTVWLPGTRTGKPVDPDYKVQPGEWVQVKSKEEIAASLEPDGYDRGLWFDREMLPYLGGTYQVRGRVTRLINDRTGRMIVFKTECVKLEGVVCSGDLSLHRYLCPRATYPYWRENWLRPVTIGRQISTPGSNDLLPSNPETESNREYI